MMLKLHFTKYFSFFSSFWVLLNCLQHAAWLLVKQEMGKRNLSLGRSDAVQLKEAYKWITHPLFSEGLGVPVDGKSLFEVSVVFAHPETDEDCRFLTEQEGESWAQVSTTPSVFTRMAVLKALNKIKEEDFLTQFPRPPDSPKTACTVLEIECTHGAVFVAGNYLLSDAHHSVLLSDVSLAGRYNKYSRNLPQTPWIIDGERKMESSVEELISDHLLAVFKAESKCSCFNFSSSGREDVDVRTLGNGKMASAPPDLNQLIPCEAVAYCSHLEQWEVLGSTGIESCRQTFSPLELSPYLTPPAFTRMLTSINTFLFHGGRVLPGRPFAVELLNPHRVHFTSQEVKELQQKINKASDKIQVRDLQLVTREAVGYMKEGEEGRSKTYSALIWTNKAIQKNDIGFLNDLKDLKIDQKTPLRVLHRRPLAVRTRAIHSMETQYLDEHHFRLYLKTQAGTPSYIKEFVHGDFGRTKPNIGSLMNVTADILELDVELETARAMCHLTLVRLADTPSDIIP
ncbi:hypothetical protein U0070_017709 [Myodes glareolus]|uniref:tRNA pseudouridine(55) synthase n=1 Tax=Myodes glareolus TaxID=447135 RepID=A0AAW0K6I5_MYOGA